MRYKFVFILIFVLLLVIVCGKVMKTFSSANLLEQNFDFNATNMGLKQVKKTDQWLPQGDGYKLVVYSYKNFDESTDIETFKRLPILDDLPVNSLPNEYINLTAGYYKLITDKNDDRNFSLLLIDTTTHTIIAYFQVY